MPTSAPDDTTPMVVVTEEIDAPASVVFETLLDAGSLPQWFGAPGGGTTDDWSIDPRPDGAWSATTRDARGREGELSGTFIDVDAPHTLAFTWFDSNDASSNGIVRFTLEELVVDGDARTRLTVTHAAALASSRQLPLAHGAASASADWRWRLEALVQLLGQSLVVSIWQ